MENLDQFTDEELRRMERQIARKHLDKFPFGSVAWAFSNMAVWLSLWPLVFTGTLPLWAAFPISVICCSLFYLPSHEAQHSIIAMPGKPLRWLNELVGQMSGMPLVLPYRVLRATHMEHHKYTNDPERDPDFGTHAPTAWGAIWASLQWRQPRPNGEPNDYIKTLERLGRQDLILEVVIYQAVFISILSLLAWNGYALEAFFLWWLPRHLAVIYLHFFLSWAPHSKPHLTTGRYKDTRSFRSHVGNIGSMGMQFHVVHHLHPRIPLLRTPRAYWEMRPIIEKLGAPVSEL